MMPEDRLRSALQRLVPPPDEAAGWQQVNRRMARAKRARVAIVSVAAVMALGLGAAVVDGVQHDGTQHVDLASPPQTTGPRTTGIDTTGPSTPGGPTTAGPAGTGGTTSPGGSTEPGSTDPTTPVTTNGGSTPVSTAGTGGGTRPTQPNSGATTVPGHSGTSATTLPSTTDPGPATTVPSVDTAGVALDEAAVQHQIEDYLTPYDSQVHGVSETHLATNAAAGGPQWRISVALRADATGLAADLLQRFPGHVLVTVGFFPYPNGPTAGASCATPAPAPGLPASVSATAKVAPVARGADFSGTVTITNQIAVPLPVLNGTTNVDLLLPGTNTVVATYDGRATTGAASTTLGLGASTDVSITGGTGSCTGLGGYALPAGTYDGRIRISVDGVLSEFRFPVVVTG